MLIVNLRLEDEKGDMRTFLYPLVSAGAHQHGFGDMRGSGRAADSPKRFPPDDELLVDVHADTLIELRRAGRVSGVHAQRHAQKPTPAKLAEALQEKRTAVAAAAPGAAHADRAHVAGRRARLVADDSRELVAVPDDEPERGVEVGPVPLTRPPLLERLGLVLPVLGERLLEGGMEILGVTLGEGLDVRRRLGRLLLELDRHLPEAAHLVVAMSLEEVGCRSVTRHGPGVDPFHVLLGKPRLHELEEPGAEAAPPGGRADGAGAVAAAAERLRERAGEEPAVFLEKPGVRLERDRVQPALDCDRIQPGGTTHHRFLDRAEQLCDRGQIVSRRRTEAHAARESRVSARPSNVCSSTSGCGSASSPRRLIQTVRSPSLVAGAMSWKRLAPTWTCPSGAAPLRAKNSCQCAGAGLYEPISEATTVTSNSTPTRPSEAARKSGSVFERTARRQPCRRASASAAGTSANGSHSGSDRASASCSSPDAPSRASAIAITSR